MSRGRLALGAAGEYAWQTAAETAVLRFFRTLIKRRRHQLCVHALAANFDFYRRSDRGMLGRNIGQRNIFLQERRRRAAGDVANLASSVVENLVSVAGDSPIDHLQSDQGFLHAASFRLLQCGAPDKIRFLHLAETIESRFPHVDRVRDFVSVEREFAFETKRVARTQSAGDDAKLFPRLQNRVPDARAGLFVRWNVNLVSRL